MFLLIFYRVAVVVYMLYFFATNWRNKE